MVGQTDAVNLVIDPEFRALIPPLTDAERQQLEDNIKADGCFDRDPCRPSRKLDIDRRHKAKREDPPLFDAA